MDRYKGAKPRLISQGAYGVVYKVRDRQTQEFVAMKVASRTDDDPDGGVPAMLIREVSLLKELSSHPNIVTLRDCLVVENSSHPALVFEYMATDLHKLIASYSERSLRIPPATVKSLLSQLIHGLEHCHKNQVIHRDLKPSNLLVDEATLSLKIADFGLARSLSPALACHHLTQNVVTLWYRCPEVLLGETDYSFALDCWSVGCIFAELVQQEPLFPGPYLIEIEQVMRIFSMLGTPTSLSWPGVEELPYWNEDWPRFRPHGFGNDLCHYLDAMGLDLLQRLLTLDPHARTTVKQAGRHPYFHCQENSAASEQTAPVAMDTSSQSEGEENVGDNHHCRPVKSRRLLCFSGAAKESRGYET